MANVAGTILVALELDPSQSESGLKEARRDQGNRASISGRAVAGAGGEFVPAFHFLRHLDTGFSCLGRWTRRRQFPLR